MLFPDCDYPPSGFKTREQMRPDPRTGKVPLNGFEPLPDTPNWDLLLPPCRLDFKYYLWEDYGKGDEQQQQALAPQIQPPKIRQPSPSPAPSAFASSTASSTLDAPSPFSSFNHDSSTSVDGDSQSGPSPDFEERKLCDEHFQTTTPDGWQDEETAVWSDAEGEHDSSDDDIPAIESQPDVAHGTRTRPTIPLPARHTSSVLPSGNLTTPPRVSGPSSSGRLSCDTSSYTDETDSQPDDDSDSDYEDARSTLKRPRASAPKRQRTNANTALPSGQNKGKARATAKPAARASEQRYSQDDDGEWHFARNTPSALPSGNLTTPPRVSGPSSSTVSSNTSSYTDETDSQPDDDSDYEDSDTRSTRKRPRASSSAPKRQRTNANTALPRGQNKGKARATAKPAAGASEQRYSQDDDGQWHCLYPGCEANLKGVSTENGVRRHWNSDHGPRGTCPACGKQCKNTRKDLLRKHLNNSCPAKGKTVWTVAMEKMNKELVKRRRRS